MDCESAVSPPNRFDTNGPAASLTDLKKDLYRFRPNESVTLGKFAGMAVNGLQISLSITAACFNGVPRGHPAFKYIETLYDYSTQSEEPFFDYEVRNDVGRFLVHPAGELNGKNLR